VSRRRRRAREEGFEQQLDASLFHRAAKKTALDARRATPSIILFYRDLQHLQFLDDAEVIRPRPAFRAEGWPLGDRDRRPVCARRGALDRWHTFVCRSTPAKSRPVQRPLTGNAPMPARFRVHPQRQRDRVGRSTLFMKVKIGTPRPPAHLEELSRLRLDALARIDNITPRPPPSAHDKYPRKVLCPCIQQIHGYPS